MSDKDSFLQDVFASLPSFEKQSESQRVVYCVWQTWNAVHMDGFGLCFINNPETLSHLVQSFEEIGASQTAEIYRRALSMVFPDAVVPEDIDEATVSDAISDSLMEELDAIDQHFYRNPPDDIIELLFSYIKARGTEL